MIELAHNWAAKHPRIPRRWKSVTNRHDICYNFRACPAIEQLDGYSIRLNPTQIREKTHSPSICHIVCHTQMRGNVLWRGRNSTGKAAG
jgi:hypothetical protein